MPRRIKIETLLAPSGIYRRAALPAAGYRPTANSRFAVVRAGYGPWLLIHVKSGAQLDSALPVLPRKLGMGDKLAAAAAWEAATHLDFSDFDALPAVTSEAVEEPRLRGYDVAKLGRTVSEMKRLASLAIEAAA